MKPRQGYREGCQKLPTWTPKKVTGLSSQMRTIIVMQKNNSTCQHSSVVVLDDPMQLLKCFTASVHIDDCPCETYNKPFQSQHIETITFFMENNYLNLCGLVGDPGWYYSIALRLVPGVKQHTTHPGFIASNNLFKKCIPSYCL